VPRLKYYRDKYGYSAGDFPNAEIISDCSIALPVAWHLSKSDLTYVIEQLENAFAEMSV
jgi:dTDP-4-amino-4,6-dideoxygalactose transaminase